MKSCLHFYHQSTQTGTDDCRDVEMELIKLKRVPSEDFTFIEDYPIADEPVTIIADIDDAYLGIKIVNRTLRSLYPCLVCFDPMDLQICMFASR